MPAVAAQGPIDSAAVVTGVVEWFRLDPATGAAARREWAVPAGGDRSAHGRVLWVSGGAPVSGTLVRLEPGDHFARTDSTGSFRLDVPRGRYLLTVLYLGAVRASDSVTNSEAGVEVLVALARPDPDLLECVRGVVAK